MTRSMLHLLIAAAVLGCSKPGPTESTEPSKDAGRSRRFGEKTQMENNLKQLGLAYHSFATSNNGRGPKDAKELGPYFENDKRLLDMLDKNEIVLIWGVSLNDSLFVTVLGYEKDADTKGGIVMLIDGMVHDVTAERFKELPLATPKK